MAGSLTRDAFSGPPAPPFEGGWGDGDSSPEGRGSSRGASFTGLYVLLAVTTMVFAAFTSAMVVRRGFSGDWVSMHKPGILWVNTAILLASSFALEAARRALRNHKRDRFNVWWTAGTVLGFLFLGGQALAWRQLQSAGVFLATNPSSAFFYILTGAHAVHLIGGVAALLYVDVQALRLRLGPAKRTAIDVSTIFWHFLDLLWLYLMLLFYVWG
ncbi:MAG TPA: cytochrome c oxidase subunit 3 [Candidatus Acidoferrum sp.]|nr:cytochrome c oxidase subunit 3 [Candidatus Acidoferrum sp.]